MFNALSAARARYPPNLCAHSARVRAFLTGTSRAPTGTEAHVIEKVSAGRAAIQLILNFECFWSCRRDDVILDAVHAVDVAAAYSGDVIMERKLARDG